MRDKKSPVSVCLRDGLVGEELRNRIRGNTNVRKLSRVQRC